MSTGKYILKGHTPVKELDVVTWAKWLGRHSRRVKLSKLKSGIRVSTVFLGLDYTFPLENDAHPLLFETMVFDDTDTEDVGRDLDMDRYSTWSEAVAGHRHMVLKWTDKERVADARRKSEWEKLESLKEKAKKNIIKS